MENTFATVIVPVESVEIARTTFPEMFTAGFSETGELPATHFVSTGFFDALELDKIVNEEPFPFVIKFGSFSEEKIGLKMCREM